MTKKHTLLLSALCLVLAALAVLFLCLWQKEKKANEPPVLGFAAEKIFLTAEETVAADAAAVSAYLAERNAAGPWEVKVVFRGLLSEGAVRILLQDVCDGSLTPIYEDVLTTVYSFSVSEDTATDALIALSHESLVKSLSFGDIGAFSKN